ncbi:hypothetical protein [Mycobacterium attenuatum]|uniref:hypothetical protein n=1 Tax=Mycobacterium attenuatum TaxID=2341086 RepID=UPI000F01F3D5|nr:hypothetical protein [Mycobacterium attenuatum]VBA47922.1 hypothetical protein LAUMK41_00640 [Mycobacterium attenuatum]
MRLDAAARQARDELALRLFLGGLPYREIGKHVDLSVGGVHKVVSRMLQRHAPRRELLLDEAVAIYLERLESLWAATYPRAVKGDVRAVEACRRLLDQLGRAQGLYGSAASAPLVRDDVPLPEDDGEPDDELEAWRKRREQPGYTGYAGSG